MVDKKSVSSGEEAPWLWLEATLYEPFQCGNFAPEMLVLEGGSPSTAQPGCVFYSLSIGSHRSGLV